MKFFCPEPLASQPLFMQFFFRFAPEQTIGGLFKDNLPPNFFEREAEFVDISQAQAVILPNNFTAPGQEAHAYIARYADEAAERNLPIFIFSCGDFTSDIVFDPRVFVFRLSIYRSKASPQDICLPTLTEDLGQQGITLRSKNQLPTVSFCGKAGFTSSREALVSGARRAYYSLLGLFNPLVQARIRGVFWRRWALAACAHSNLLKTLFIMRKGFSGARSTIDVAPEEARAAFIRSIVESDFVLAPKGDGNYSNRFLEALSMGRIPVLIDTDTVLPLEDNIDYSKIVVRVPMKEVAQTPYYIKQFYENLNEQEWQERQQLARQIFENYLRQDMFFKSYFNHFLKISI